MNYVFIQIINMKERDNFHWVPSTLALFFSIGVLAAGVIIVILDAIFNLGLS